MSNFCVQCVPTYVMGVFLFFFNSLSPILTQIYIWPTLLHDAVLFPQFFLTHDLINQISLMKD